MFVHRAVLKAAALALPCRLAPPPVAWAGGSGMPVTAAAAVRGPPAVRPLRAFRLDFGVTVGGPNRSTRLTGFHRL
ncbi:hypothetical protein [Kitasatospora sp. HPMI-4]|uniref:hypothetical protein n=1 Tax=Kitasatospora sp. HPMI-4 TaxID=3448443 RepID=UPI003F19DF79